MSIETQIVARKLFDDLQTEFPHLVMNDEAEDPHIDMFLTIPQQPGLSFEVHLNLQNDDELHLCVGAFWCSWFPVTKPGVARNFHDAVTGVLAGRYRIVEYVRWGQTVEGVLQAPNKDGWKTMARSTFALLPASWFSEKRILINEFVS